MKKALLALSLAVPCALLAGCLPGSHLVKQTIPPQQQGVYQEVQTGTPPQAGYVELNILSSLKTHKPWSHTASDTHGTEEYTMLVKIDGQAMTLKGKIGEENTEARSLRDPEAGEGVRYQFMKKVRLKGGIHRIAVVIPEDGVALERELVLPEEGFHYLVIEPVYGSTPGRQGTGFFQTRSFKEGISSVVLMLNGVRF
jgi:hypothetical protein